MRKLLPLLIATLALNAFAVFTLAQTREQKDLERQLKEYISAHGDIAPQRTVDAPSERIKPLLTVIMTQLNYVMDSESPSQLVFSVELVGARIELAKMFGAMGGEDLAGNPRRILRFITVEQNGRTLVSANSENVTQLRTGGVRRVPHNSKDFRGTVQLILDAMEKLLRDEQRSASLSVQQAPPKSAELM